VQGECNGKGKAEDFHFPLPSRRLFYPKIVQGECNVKGKAEDFPFSIAGLPPILLKGSARRVQCKRKSRKFSIFLCRTAA